LESLMAAKNGISHGPSTFSSLTNLQNLVLAHNELTSFHIPATFKKLKKLNLSCNCLTQLVLFDFITSPNELKVLLIQENPVSQNLDSSKPVKEILLHLSSMFWCRVAWHLSQTKRT
jgi:Leucine-rich repeat (LRR) protein